MKKSTLLTVASVGAVALTSAMTFAAWDNLTAESTSDAVTLRKINVAEETKLALTANDVNSDLSSSFMPTASGNVKFKVENLDSTITDSKLTFNTEVKGAEDKDVTNNCNVKIYQTDDSAKNDIATSGDNSVEATNEYTVVVTPNNDADGWALADTPLTVTVTATLGKTQANQ